MTVDGDFFVPSAIVLPLELVREGRDALIRALGPGGKAIGRAALVGGNPADAENNIAVSSFTGYSGWLSQVSNPTGVITPGGEDLNEVILSQKSNVLGRLPSKWFDGFLRGITSSPQVDPKIGEKWARNWGGGFGGTGSGQGASIPLSISGFSGLVESVVAASLRFLAGDARFRKFPAALTDIRSDDGAPSLLPQLARQSVSAISGIITRTLVKILVAERVGVGPPDIALFAATQKARAEQAILGFTRPGLNITIDFVRSSTRNLAVRIARAP